MRVSLTALSAKDKGLLLILAGIFMIISSVFLSSGFRPNFSLVTNIQIGEIVISQGDYVSSKGNYYTENYEPSYYKNHLAIKTSHSVIFSTAILLFGVWTYRKK